MWIILTNINTILHNSYPNVFRCVLVFHIYSFIYMYLQKPFLELPEMSIWMVVVDNICVILLQHCAQRRLSLLIGSQTWGIAKYLTSDVIICHTKRKESHWWRHNCDLDRPPIALTLRWDWVSVCYTMIQARLKESFEHEIPSVLAWDKFVILHLLTRIREFICF